jgi:hypothetical protein
VALILKEIEVFTSHPIDPSKLARQPLLKSRWDMMVAVPKIVRVKVVRRGYILDTLCNFLKGPKLARHMRKICG